MTRKREWNGSIWVSTSGDDFLLWSRTTLQRLYSTFANGLPGKGLFLLRVTLSTFLICEARSSLVGSVLSGSTLISAAAAAAGVFLCLGLWTPVAGAFATLLELYLLYCHQMNLWPPLLAAAMSASLALLGPGAWSVDAQIYGRKRISVHDR